MVNNDSTSASEDGSTKRILAPVGTTALIINSAGYLETLYVKDISVVGILANGYITAERYPVNTSIKGILLNIPPCELGGHSRITLLINEGKVIRTLIDQVSKTVCYAIEFMNESSYVHQTLERIVNMQEKRILLSAAGSFNTIKPDPQE